MKKMTHRTDSTGIDESGLLLYKQAVDSSEDIIAAVDAEYRYIMVNQKLLDLHSAACEDVMGKRVQELIGRQLFTQRIQPNIDKCLHGAVVKLEEPALFNTQEWQREQVTYLPLRQDGKILGVVYSVRDVSEEYTKRQALLKSIEEKEFLMKELNHRVKNNLAIIGSLISQKEPDTQDPADLSDIASRIQSIQIVHELLYQTGSVSHLRMDRYIRKLLESIFSCHSPREVAIDYRIEEIKLPIQSVVSIGLILNEIATNAIKYGFCGQEKQRLGVKLRREGAESCLLQIRHEDHIFPEEITLDTPRTFGLRLVTALVSQLGGSIELEKSPDTLFSIRFPLKQ